MRLFMRSRIDGLDAVSMVSPSCLQVDLPHLLRLRPVPTFGGTRLSRPSCNIGLEGRACRARSTSLDDPL